MTKTNPTFYVYEVLCSYGELRIFGPYQSLEESKSKTTDGQARGLDGDKTVYTFVKIEDNVQEVLGDVTFEDECRVDEGDDLRTESWKQNPNPCNPSKLKI